jgi:hypothetical protein
MKIHPLTDIELNFIFDKTPTFRGIFNRDLKGLVKQSFSS